MPSLLVEEQQFKTEPVSKQDQSTNQQQQLPEHYINGQDQPVNKQEQPLTTTNTMGSITALNPATNNIPPTTTDQQLPLFYETFLESISNDIVQYLSKRNETPSSSKPPSNNNLTPTPSNNSHHARKRSSTSRPGKPQGIDRKRHKHTDRVSK